MSSQWTQQLQDEAAACCDGRLLEEQQGSYEALQSSDLSVLRGMRVVPVVLVVMLNGVKGLDKQALASIGKASNVTIFMEDVGEGARAPKPNRMEGLSGRIGKLR